MECIFCKKENESKSIEHIVSESLGNKTYLMERNSVCDACNQKFSKFEGEMLSSSVFLMERARLGVVTKKGIPASGQLGGFKIQGNKEFIKNLINLSGLKEEDLGDWDEGKKTFTLKLPTFEKNEVAVSKSLLKIGLEALYTSKRKVYKQYNFDELRGFLDNSNPKVWPLAVTRKEIGKFISIPINHNKHLLSKIRCLLLFQEIDEKTLLFKFSYGGISMIVNLIDRNLKWVENYNIDEFNVLYPEHLRRKLKGTVNVS